MQHKLSQLKQHPNYDKAMHWGKLISITGGAQVIVQAVGFVCGILIIRLLPVQEYAFYTLANTMLGTMTVLADGGISAGVMAQGGKIWQDREKLGVVLATGLDLRRKFAIVSLLVSVPILFYLLVHNNASWITALLIVVSLIPAFFAALSDSLLEIAPKLHQAILPLQKNQVMVGIGRLILTTLSLFAFPWAFLAIIASGLPRIYGNIKLKEITLGFANTNQQSNTVIRKDILTMVKRILPGAIYYSLSGQITIWLISLFGNPTSVAQLGALGRLAMLLSLFSVLINTLIIPRFARLAEEKSLLLYRFFQILGTLIIVLLFIITIVYLLPNQILWILGNEYSGLHTELILSIVGSCISLIAGVAYSLFTARGWVYHPAIFIFCNIGTIIALLFFVDISSLNGVLLLNIAVAFVALFLNVIYCISKIISIKNTSVNTTII
jgi:O-antigen/teichoic acid export membrane protein